MRNILDRIIGSIVLTSAGYYVYCNYKKLSISKENLKLTDIGLNQHDVSNIVSELNFLLREISSNTEYITIDKIKTTDDIKKYIIKCIRAELDLPKTSKIRRR